MKKIVTAALTVLTALALAGCTAATSAPTPMPSPTPSAVPTPQPTLAPTPPLTPPEEENMQLQLSFGDGQTATVTLYDNAASRDFLSLLPLTVECEDYNATEKIAYLPRALDTSHAPDGFEPVAGDFAYYAPWGNLSIFYRDFRYSAQLVSLGFFEQGLDALTAMTGSFSVEITALTN